MDDLNRALGDISNIRRQMARSTEFWVWPSDTICLWVAVLSAGLTGVQMYTRTRRIHSGMSDEMMQMAVEQSSAAARVVALFPS